MQTTVRHHGPHEKIPLPSLTSHEVTAGRLWMAPTIPAWAVLNSQESLALQALQTSQTISDAVNVLASELGDVQRATSLVQHVLDILSRRGFFATNRAEYTRRLHIQLHLTNRCNLRCIHCYMDSGKAINDELTYEEWAALIGYVASRVKRPYLSISGGEPLLVPYVCDLISHARSSGFDEVGLITNGMLLSRETVRKLEDSGLTNIAVSLDGATEAVNDLVRGRGVFARVVANLAHLRGSTIRASINITVMKTNYNDLLDNLPALLKLLPIPVDVSLGLFIGEGRGRKIFAEAFLRDPNRAVREIVRSIGDLRTVRPRQPRYSCGYGETIVVLANGDLAPCITPRFVRGNIRRDGLAAVDSLIQESLDAEVDRLPVCRDCDLRYICGGGCHQSQIARFGRAQQVDCPVEFRRQLYERLASGAMG